MQTQHFILRVIAVFLRLKFKCRMRVQFKGGASTRDVESHNGVYRFQEDLSLQSKNSFIQLNLALVTEKGSNYSGGVLRINLKELSTTPGQSVTLPISKCIDKEAWCEFQVLVTTDRCTEHKVISNETNQYPPTPPKKVHQNSSPHITDTQSQLYLPIPHNFLQNNLSRRDTCQTTRINYFGQRRNGKDSKERTRSPNISFTNRTSPDLIDYRQKTQEALQQAEFSMTRVKRMQLRLNEEGRRLKQQQEKRKSLESNEHRLKMQILSLKMQMEEIVKELNKKDHQLKQLAEELTLSKIQQHKLDKAKEQLRLQQHEIKCLNQNICSYESQLADLKRAYQFEITKVEAQLKRVKVEMKKLNKSAEEKQENLQAELNRSEAQLTSLKLKSLCFSAQQQLSIKAKSIFDLDCKVEGKDSIVLEQERLELKKQIELLRVQAQEKIMSLENQKTEMRVQIAILRNQHDRQKGLLSKLLHQKKNLQIMQSDLKVRLQEDQKQMKIVKQRYEQEIRRNQALTQQNNRQILKFQHLYQQIQDLQKAGLDESQQNKKQIQFLTERYRQAQQDNRLLHQQLQASSSQIHQAQRTESALRNQLSCLKDREKHWKGLLSKKEAQCIQIRGQFDALSQKRMDNSCQFTPNFSFLQQEEQEEDQKLDKILSTFQSHQKYLQEQLTTQKIKNYELTSQINLIKEQIEKVSSRQNQYKQFEKASEKQAENCKIRAMQLQKQIKQLERNIQRYQQQLRSSQQQLEKQKDNNKNLLNQHQLLEYNISLAHQQVASLQSEHSSLKKQCKGYETEIESFKSQVQYLEQQRQNYMKINEELQFNVRNSKQQLSSITAQIKQEAQKRSCDQKKHRQDVLKYQNKVKIMKHEGQKFKQALRKIVIDYTTANSSTFRIALSAPTKFLRSDSSARLLPNQLLLEVEDLLKHQSNYTTQLESKLEQVEKELSEAREERILSMNKAQRMEAELRCQLESSISNNDNMKTFYTQREENMKKRIQQDEWNINCLTQEIRSYRQVKQHLSDQLNQKIEEIERLQNQYRQTSERTQSRIRSLNQQIQELTKQLQDLQDHCSKLQQNNHSYTEQQQSWQLQKSHLTQKIDRLQQRLTKDQINERHLDNVNAQMKQIISSKQIQVLQLTQVNRQLYADLERSQTQRTQAQSVVNGLMKEKQHLHQKYLTLQRQKVHLQNVQDSLNSKISSLQKALLNLQQTNQTFQLNHETLQRANTQLQYQKQQLSQQLLDQERRAMKQLQKIQSLESSLKQKIIQQTYLKDAAESQTHESDVKIKEIKAINIELQSRIAEQRRNKQALKLEVQRLHITIEDLKNELAQYKQANNALRNQLSLNELKVTEFGSVQKRYEQQLRSKEQELVLFKDKLCKIQAQLEQRDLTNYRLSSQIFQLQSQSQKQIQDISNKLSQQEANTLGYVALTQQLELKLKQSLSKLDRECQRSHKLEMEAIKLSSRLNLTGEQLTKQNDKIQNLSHQLRVAKSISQNHRMKLEEIETRNSEIIAKLNEQITRKQSQMQKLRSQNQILDLTINNSRQDLSRIEAEFKKAQQKEALLLENERKLQQQLKLFKEESKNFEWNCEREIKKAFGANLRYIQQIEKQGDQDLERWVRLTEEGILQSIKRLIQFLK